MQKSKVLKLTLNEKNIRLFVDLLKNAKTPFSMQVSNYTTKIISEPYNVSFVKGLQSKRVFAAASYLKKDLAGKKIPNVDMKKCDYYDTNFRGLEFYSDRCFNIDIKQAYATILYMDGFITKKTYDYLKNLPKMERLAAVGMLASHKTIFRHDKLGRIIKVEEIINPLSDFFFYCVQKTENIIHDVINKILQEAFLFSWVDGVYYMNENTGYKNVTMQYLKTEYGLESTFKELNNFEVKIKNQSYRISFLQDGEEKVFNIPLPVMQLKKDIINYLLEKKY